MVIKRLEDIEREKQEEKRERFKRQITEDARDVIEGVLGGPKKPAHKNTMSDIFWFIAKIFFLIILLMVIVNLVLGNIWLLKFFWREFFAGG